MTCWRWKRRIAARPFVDCGWWLVTEALDQLIGYVFETIIQTERFQNHLKKRHVKLIEALKSIIPSSCPPRSDLLLHLHFFRDSRPVNETRIFPRWFRLSSLHPPLSFPLGYLRTPELAATHGCVPVALAVLPIGTAPHLASVPADAVHRVKPEAHAFPDKTRAIAADKQGENCERWARGARCKS